MKYPKLLSAMKGANFHSVNNPSARPAIAQPIASGWDLALMKYPAPSPSSAGGNMIA